MRIKTRERNRGNGSPQIHDRQTGVQDNGSIPENHQPGNITFYGLPFGYDCEVTCSCGHRSDGIGQSKREAEDNALYWHSEHIRILTEHSDRCPSDLELAEL